MFKALLAVIHDSRLPHCWRWESRNVWLRTSISAEP